MPQPRFNRQVETGPSTPLREVRLGNFKSVRSAAVELRPLTAIVGRNSSGKSTLLQGILALSQAVRRQVVSRAFPLNGDLVRLGTFDEVLNFDVDPASGIDIGFTAEVDYRIAAPLRGSERGMTSGSVKWDAHLVASADDSRSGQAEISTIEFAVNSSREGDAVDDVSLTISEILGLSQDTLTLDRPMMIFGRGDAELDIDGRIVDMRSGKSSRVERMVMSGGLPVRVFRLDTRFNVRFRLWWDMASEMLEEERLKARQEMGAALAEEENQVSLRETLRKDTLWALKFAKDCLTSDDRIERDSAVNRRMMQMRRISMHGADMARFEYRIINLKADQRFKLAVIMNDLGERAFGEQLRESLVKSKADWLDQTVRDEPTTDVHQILEQATFGTYSLFQQVRYLGPLRAKPQVMYSPGIGEVDLGPEGEFAAAYLHANAARKILVPLPGGGTRQMPLGEGLNLWLEELGLADGASAKDRGRLGIGLYVRPVGREQTVDLTSVGVGVSQALPVVLLCLLSTPGSIVLIEQPELHLHPAMQLKLADFLLACVRTGRQIVIETHSEHVINRLRLHVVSDEGEGFGTADVVRLLFAEQENGETLYRISDINEIGGLSSDWPKGFLDVAADESTRLLQQALAKKRASHKKKS